LEEIEGHRLYSAFFLSANSGMRRGEVMGLRWEDVDLDASRLSVRHAVLNVAYELVTSDVKTPTSRRTIDLDARTVAVLRAWRRAATSCSAPSADSALRPRTRQHCGRYRRSVPYRVEQ